MKVPLQLDPPPGRNTDMMNETTVTLSTQETLTRQIAYMIWIWNALLLTCVVTGLMGAPSMVSTGSASAPAVAAIHK